MYKISKYDVVKCCIEDGYGLCFFSCCDLDFFNDILLFLKVILFEIIRCICYFFLVYKCLKKKKYYF